MKFLSKGSKAVGDIAVVFSGKALSAGLVFLVNIILARVLGPKEFGLFSLSAVIMILISGVVGGYVGQALVKFSSFYLQKEQERCNLLHLSAPFRGISMISFSLEKTEKLLNYFFINPHEELY